MLGSLFGYLSAEPDILPALKVLLPLQAWESACADPIFFFAHVEFWSNARVLRLLYFNFEPVAITLGHFSVRQSL